MSFICDESFFNVFVFTSNNTMLPMLVQLPCCAPASTGANGQKVVVGGALVSWEERLGLIDSCGTLSEHHNEVFLCFASH